MPKAFETFSSWEKKDARVTFVKEVRLQGALVSRMPSMATRFRSGGLDSISALSDGGEQPVVSLRFLPGLCRPRLQSDK